jgi:hypothetical protein
VAMFSRRTLQRLLDENSQFLRKSQTRRLVKELNRVSDPSKLGRDISLSWEWEVVLLNVLSKVGKVAYERGFDGHTKGDIYFEDRDAGK